jgi:hypothetical protein
METSFSLTMLLSSIAGSLYTVLLRMFHTFQVNCLFLNGTATLHNLNLYTGVPVPDTSVTIFSTLGIFSSHNPPQALIHGLKPFRILLQNRRGRERDFGNRFPGLLETAETASKVSPIPKKSLPRSR